MSKSYDYGTITHLIGVWVSENADSLLDNIDEVLALAESRTESDLNLEIFDGLNEDIQLNAGDTTLNKPEDWGATRSLYVRDPATNFPVLMHPRTEEFVSAFLQGGLTEVPQYYAELNETSWLVAPTYSATLNFRVRFLSRQVGLSVTNSTTWLSRNFGHLLFAACLLEASTILRLGMTDDLKSRYYREILPPCQRELSSLMRMDYTPVKSGPDDEE